jgi:tRNA (guanine37-N1)-methyltransferase
MSGDHGKIAEWRRAQALARTSRRRPELLAEATLDEAERSRLENILEEQADEES